MPKERTGVSNLTCESRSLGGYRESECLKCESVTGRGFSLTGKDFQSSSESFLGKHTFEMLATSRSLSDGSTQSASALGVSI